MRPLRLSCEVVPSLEGGVSISTLERAKGFLRGEGWRTKRPQALFEGAGLARGARVEGRRAGGGRG